MASFYITSQLITYFLDSPAKTLHIPLLEEKLQYLAEHNDYDVLFLGTSRMFRGIDPSYVESEAHRKGCTIRAYNMGIPGLSFVEQQYIIERLGRQNLHFKTIVLEPYSVPDRTLSQFLSLQRRHFYNNNHINDIIQDHFSMPNVEGPKTHIMHTFYLAYSYLYEQTGVSRLSKYLFQYRSSNDEPVKTINQEGFQSTDDMDDERMKKRRNAFLKRVNAFEEKVRNASNSTSEDPSKVNNRIELVNKTITKVHDSKSDAAIVIMPTIDFVSNSRYLEQKLRTRLDPRTPILNFNRPEQYTHLFTIDNWFDESHLNRQGSIVFSKLLGRSLCTLPKRD